MLWRRDWSAAYEARHNRTGRVELARATVLVATIKLPIAVFNVWLDEKNRLTPERDHIPAFNAALTAFRDQSNRHAANHILGTQKRAMPCVNLSDRVR